MATVLLIEDNPGDAVLIREMYHDADIVGDEYKIVHVKRASEALERLRTDTFDVVLSDLSLPDTQGLETLKRLLSAAPDVPVILMTGSNSEQFITAALNLGAQDYLIKGNLDGQVLARSTSYAIERQKAQNDINKASDRARALDEQRQNLLKLNQAKDDFISLASHQLRTPATAVKQYLGLLIEGHLNIDISDEALVYIRTAYENNDRQLNIINDLLKTAQLDSGRNQLTKTPQDINELLETIIAEHMPLMKTRQQTVDYAYPSPLIASVDTIELKIALSNLIENASKYSYPGSKIHVNLHRKHHEVIIEVTDEGVGIKAKDIDNIFDKFTRFDNELSDTVNGNGLGLYFVNRIIKLHGGTIDVSSELDKGTTFTVTIPV